MSLERIADLPADANIKRILVIKWSALGDIMIASALFESIRQAFPNARIDLDTRPAMRPLFDKDPHFDRVLAFEEYRKIQGPVAIATWIQQIRAQSYNLIIDLQSNDRSRMLLSGLRLTASKVQWMLGTHARFPYNIAPDSQLSDVHAYAHLSAALSAGGIPVIEGRPSFPVSDAARKRVRSLLDTSGVSAHTYAVFLPGSHAAALTKRWGVENYASLARKLVEQHNMRSLLIGSKDEAMECADIQRKAGEAVINLCDKTRIEDIVPICEQAKVIIANDTGTAHIASATATPMLVICGPTNPSRVKPVGAQVETIQADIECRNCYQKTCSHHSCMRQLDVDQIYTKVRKIQDDLDVH